MKRIFVTLAILSTVLLFVAFALGWSIDDPRVRDVAVQKQVGNHLLIAMGGLIFAVLVHAIALTYFMGTGRWMEETRQVYRLPEKWQAESNSMKYRTLPWMAAALVMLILTGAMGAMCDPASAASVQAFGDVSMATLHFLTASATVAVNVIVNVVQYQAIDRNSQLVQEVMNEVHRIRTEKGLPIS